MSPTVMRNKDADSASATFGGAPSSRYLRSEWECPAHRAGLPPVLSVRPERRRHTYRGDGWCSGGQLQMLENSARDRRVENGRDVAQAAAAARAGEHVA